MRSKSTLHPWPTFTLLVLSLCTAQAKHLFAQSVNVLPKDLEGVAITQNLDAQIPLDLEFTDSGGKQITLGQLFDGKRPTILTMNYSDCPMLCSLQLNGLIDAIKPMTWSLGQQYQIITVSIDPLEPPERAQLTKQKYLEEYGRLGGGAGWHFLTTQKEERIKKLADCIGFGYKYVPEKRQFMHPALLTICTPEGRRVAIFQRHQVQPPRFAARAGRSRPRQGRLGHGPGLVVVFPLRCRFGQLLLGGHAPCAVRRGLDPHSSRRHIGRILDARMAQGKARSTGRDAMMPLSSIPILCHWMCHCLLQAVLLHGFRGTACGEALAQFPRFSLFAADSFWLPEQASEIAPAVDWLFYFIYAISLFFFALIVVLMVVFVVRYRRREGVESGPSPDHNTKLELTWTLIPVAIVIFIFYQGFTAYLDMRTPPSLAYEINVIAKKWQWLFKYPDGHVDEVLHVPLDEPVRLMMTSQDVIHGLYIPAFRINMDVVPGRYNKIWFRAVEPGEFQLYCTQYCGSGHSDMTSKVVVHTRSDFQSYLNKEANPLKDLSPPKAGELLYQRRAAPSATPSTARPAPGRVSRASSAKRPNS